MVNLQFIPLIRDKEIAVSVSSRPTGSTSQCLLMWNQVRLDGLEFVDFDAPIGINQPQSSPLHPVASDIPPDLTNSRTFTLRFLLEV